MSATERDSQSVTVDIYDQTYHLRGHDPAYIQRLADLVDSKMRAVASHGTTVDSLRVAVLAALNIADELMTAQQRNSTLNGTLAASESSLRTRAHSLNGLLDEVLDSSRDDSRNESRNESRNDVRRTG